MEKAIGTIVTKIYRMVLIAFITVYREVYKYQCSLHIKKAGDTIDHHLQRRLLIPLFTMHIEG